MSTAPEASVSVSTGAQALKAQEQQLYKPRKRCKHLRAPWSLRQPQLQLQPQPQMCEMVKEAAASAAGGGSKRKAGDLGRRRGARRRARG